MSEVTDTRYVGTSLTIQTAIGFLLTLITIRLVPYFVESFGWHLSMAVPTLGPAFGIWSMGRLPSLPEAMKMASGNR